MGLVCRSNLDMKGAWLGHAIVSPGWRVTFRTVREVYCGLVFGASDVPAIDNLRKSEPIGGCKTAHKSYLVAHGASQPPASILNPSDPQDLLKHGCGWSVCEVNRWTVGGFV